MVKIYHPIINQSLHLILYGVKWPKSVLYLVYNRGYAQLNVIYFSLKLSDWDIDNILLVLCWRVSSLPSHCGFTSTAFQIQTLIDPENQKPSPNIDSETGSCVIRWTRGTEVGAKWETKGPRPSGCQSGPGAWISKQPLDGQLRHERLSGCNEVAGKDWWAGYYYGRISHTIKRRRSPALWFKRAKLRA